MLTWVYGAQTPSASGRLSPGTHTPSASTHTQLAWGWQVDKDEKRGETGVGCGAHSDGCLRQEDSLAFPTPASEVSPARCG